MALLDIMLPGMDGFAVCRELRQRSESMGIIILTARTQEMEKVRRPDDGGGRLCHQTLQPL